MSTPRARASALALGAAVMSLALVAPGAAAQQVRSADVFAKDLSWRNIGNANLVGRISSIDALDDDWTHVVVGTASGGVFKSTNGGTTWDAIFDEYGSASIGDVQIFQPNPDVIWIGTGEECGRNSAAWGDGVYKSMDGGRTFDRVGLEDTYNIGQIALHPTDPDIAYVAAVGSIWGTVGRRGLFRTTDGGRTWQRLGAGLPADDGVTGAIQVIMDPRDPNVLYTAFWPRYRRPWLLVSGGPNGGIFKSTDAGASWHKLTNGLPSGDLGKIGLAISATNPNVLMAHIEAEFQPPQNVSGQPNPDYADMSKLGAGIYRSEDGGESWTFRNRYLTRPFYYNHVSISPHDPNVTFHYNQQFRISRDGGTTLENANGGDGGHCWHALWLDPHNARRYWVGSDGGLNLTHDGGGTSLRFDNINATQYYDVAYDMRDPYWVYGGLQDAGSSGGPSMTRANGIYLSDWVNLSGGDGYHAAADPTDWRWVYTESQPGTSGGNVGRMNMQTRERVSIQPRKYRNIVNYDDYITPEIEQRQEANNWGRVDPPAAQAEGGRGSGRGGGRGASFGAFRWNWKTPFILSPHNPRTIYLGANHLFKSVDQGDSWRIISPDLSKNEPEKTVRRSGGLTPDEDPGGGAELHATIITIAESPRVPGVIWVGTDDGNVQLTRDDGMTWTEVGVRMPDLPQRDLWISRVAASHHADGTAYVTVDGHRHANFRPYVFKTTDYGQTWTPITSNLPDGHPLYVVVEDPKNPNLLFVGSEFAAFYTISGGASWTRLHGGLPTVAVHDLKIHPRDNDLIAATHGRGIWIMDDITPLQQLTSDVLSSEAHLFEPPLATQWLNIQPHDDGGSLAFRGENPPRGVAMIDIYLTPAIRGDVRIEIADAARTRSCTHTRPASPGVHRLQWVMQFPGNGECQVRASGAEGGRSGRGGGRGGRGGGGQPATPGTYGITMTANGKTYTVPLVIRRDPLLAEGGR